MENNENDANIERAAELKQINNKKYYDSHREQICKNQRERKYKKSETALQHKYARDKEKVLCECGSEVTRANIAKHRKSNIHALKMKVINLEK